MSVEILMPELGESVHEGTVSRWLKKVGDFVEEDEPIVEIMTDKVNTELPSPSTGVLKEILVPEGSPIAVFGTLGIIDEADGVHEPAKPAQPAADAVVAPVSTQASQPSLETTTEEKARRFLTPLVRSIAREHNLSDAQLLQISGTGDGGRISKADVLAYIQSRGKGTVVAPVNPVVASEPPKAEKTPIAPPVPAPAASGTPLTGLRRMIAEAMVRSSQIPTVSTVTEVDLTRMVQFRERNKDAFLQDNGVKLTYTPFFLKALTDALVEFPLLNSSLSMDFVVTRNEKVNLGIAVALGAKGDEGLIVPVIRDCASKTIVDLAREVERLAKLARSNSLKIEDVQGGTFTLTNPGTYGALFGTPMIQAPHAGILGTYAIKKVPVVIEDMIAIRSIMHLVLTYDHRLIDGLVAGRFLASIRDRLQDYDFVK